MTKQKFIAITATVFFLVSVGAWAVFFELRGDGELERIFSKAPDYNVIFIALTDLRADHLGEYGYSRDTSPNLDRFARDSVLFENAFLQGSRSVMNFASLFTSQYPRAHEVVFIGQTLAPSKITLAEVLQKQEYKTAAFVRSSQLSNRYGSYGITQGFDVLRHGTNDLFGVVPLAEEWLLQNKNEKFFLFIEGYDDTYFHSPEPYEHFFDEEEYGGILSDHNQFYFSLNPKEHPNAVLSRIKTIGGQAVIEQEDANILLDQKDIEHLIVHYDGGVLYVDSFVEQLLNMFKKMGVYENSIIVIFSDHGETLDDHMNREQMRNIQLTGHAQVYDEIIHTPLIIRHPKLQSGRIDAQVQLIDLFPTILDFLKIPMPKELRNQIQGNSVVPLVEGRAPKDFNEYVYGQSEAVQDIMFVRSSKWKLMSWQGNFFTLYNLEDNPEETRNVIDKYPEIAEKLKQKLQEWNMSNIEKRSQLKL